MVAGRVAPSTTGCWPSCAPATTVEPSTWPPCAAILAGAGLDADDLENTPTLPLDPDAAARRRPGRRRRRRRSCRTAAASMPGCWPRRSSTGGRRPGTRRRPPGAAADRRRLGADGRSGDPRRRRRLRRAGADGHAASALARAVRALAVRRPRVHRAMTGYPELVGGPTRDVTVLMRLVPGLLVKDGAEGVQVAALPDGRAVAMKVADGAGRARAPVTVAALRSLGVDLRRRCRRRGRARPRRAGRPGALAGGGAMTRAGVPAARRRRYGRVEQVAPMIRRVIAENPSKFTYRGTGRTSSARRGRRHRSRPDARLATATPGRGDRR